MIGKVHVQVGQRARPWPRLIVVAIMIGALLLMMFNEVKILLLGNLFNHYGDKNGFSRKENIDDDLRLEREDSHINVHISPQRRKNMSIWVEHINLHPEDLCVHTSSSSVSSSSNSFSQDEISKRLIDRCSFYLFQMDEWKAAVVSQEQDKVFAWQQRSGLGDRLAGLVSAFNYAMTSHSNLNLIWKNLDQVFKPSCFTETKQKNSHIGSQIRLDQSQANIFKIQAHVTDLLPDPESNSYPCVAGSCEAARQKTKISCSISINSKTYSTDRPNRVDLVDKKDRIRGCANTRICRRQQKFYGRQLSTVELLGCPLQLLLSPKESFMRSQITWFLNGHTHIGTLAELLNIVRQLKTIALHLRLGDWRMAHNSNSNSKFFDAKREKATNCMMKVDKYLDPSASGATKWIVASDSEIVRDYYRQNFPDKTIMIMNPPKHIDSPKEDEKLILRETFAEWFLLGAADEMVVTTKQMRMSAFSKFARLYTLRSRYYAIEFLNHECLYKEMDYDGNTVNMPPACSENKHMGLFEAESGQKNKYKYHPPQEWLSQSHIN